MSASLVGSEMCIRDRMPQYVGDKPRAERHEDVGRTTPVPPTTPEELTRDLPVDTDVDTVVAP
eukprot:2184404-Alexandrium_andersonii.AAC.1